jgi:type VI protein secretion system component Hcp
MSMFLDVKDPAIKGESKINSKHPDWGDKITIRTMGYGVHGTPSTGGSGLAASGAQVTPLSITKEMDKSTPKLFGLLAAGDVIKVMFIRVSRPGGSSAGGADGLYEAETYEFHNVVVNEYHTSGIAGPGGLPMESWTFSFTWVKESYAAPDPNTHVVSSAKTPPFGFDFGRNAPV